LTVLNPLQVLEHALAMDDFTLAETPGIGPVQT
jgi:hypothetical protein